VLARDHERGDAGADSARDYGVAVAIERAVRQIDPDIDKLHHDYALLDLPGAQPDWRRRMLELIAIAVDEYDPAIAFFVEVLDFELIEDTPSLTNDGRAKRWVVVRPRAAQTGILLARADGDAQRAIVGNQLAGRVGFFLRVDDFDVAYRRMQAAGVAFVSAPRRAPSRMVRWWCFSTSPATAGTCSAPLSDSCVVADHRRVVVVGIGAAVDVDGELGGDCVD
jgi:catechol 2,3-dioxygenase-like lactoylglutathione lyase family enzyme